MKDFEEHHVQLREKYIEELDIEVPVRHGDKVLIHNIPAISDKMGDYPQKGHVKEVHPYGYKEMTLDADCIIRVGIPPKEANHIVEEFGDNVRIIIGPEYKSDRPDTWEEAPIEKIKDG